MHCRPRFIYGGAQALHVSQPSMSQGDAVDELWSGAARPLVSARSSFGVAPYRVRQARSQPGRAGRRRIVRSRGWRRGPRDSVGVGPKRPRSLQAQARHLRARRISQSFARILVRTMTRSAVVSAGSPAKPSAKRNCRAVHPGDLRQHADAYAMTCQATAYVADTLVRDREPDAARRCQELDGRAVLGEVLDRADSVPEAGTVIDDDRARRECPPPRRRAAARRSRPAPHRLTAKSGSSGVAPAAQTMRSGSSASTDVRCRLDFESGARPRGEQARVRDSRRNRAARRGLARRPLSAAALQSRHVLS